MPINAGCKKSTAHDSISTCQKFIWLILKSTTDMIRLEKEVAHMQRLAVSSTPMTAEKHGDLKTWRLSA